VNFLAFETILVCNPILMCELEYNIPVEVLYSSCLLASWILASVKKSLFHKAKAVNKEYAGHPSPYTGCDKYLS
jgi:hypothetical protein